MVKKIAVYGTYKTTKKVLVPQRYWKWIFHNKGTLAGKKWYKRRVWKKAKRLKKVVGKGRYEFHGSGKDLYKAVLKAQSYMSKGYVDVSAKKFVECPEEYGFEGEWIDREVES